MYDSVPVQVTHALAQLAYNATLLLYRDVLSALSHDAV